MANGLPKKLREIIRAEFPDIPLPEQEELVEQVEECMYRFGALRICTMGKVAEIYLREEVQ